MTRFNFRFFIINTLLIMLLANSSFAQAIILIDSIKQVIKREVDNKRSASITVGIIDANGTQIFSYGKFKDNSNQMPDGNTLYEIGSITKVFTSLILADMVQHGELNLNDPISKFLPKSVKTPTFNGKEITLLDLATHTSGLPRGPDNLTSNDQYVPFKDYTVDHMYDFLSRYKLAREIGSKYEYSNFGMGLLGHILSLKAGMNYETLVLKRICKPLHMDNTVVTITAKLQSLLATPHSMFNQPINNYQMGALAGAGALKSNVNDLLKFLKANLGLTKTSLLPAMELSHIVRDSAPNPNMAIPQFVCLGWNFAKVFETELINHDGNTSGSSAFIGFDKKKKVGVVVLSNSVNVIDDIAVHIIENKCQIPPFHYKWALKDTLLSTINKKGIDAAIRVYYSLKNEHKTDFPFDIEQLDALGYVDLLYSNKVKEAIEIFKLNVLEYPLAWNVYDSLGEAYMVNGDNDLAIANYQKSVEQNPNNTNGIAKLNELKTKKK